MKNERILIYPTLAAVLLLHLGMVALLWRTHQPEMKLSTDIQFVDLGSLGGGDAQEEGAAVAAPAPQPQPKLAPKPVPQPHLAAVKVKEEKADMRLKPKETPPKREPKPKPEPKPEPMPQTAAPKPVAKPIEKTPENSKAHAGTAEGDADKHGNGKGSKGKGKGKGWAQGGEGSGSSHGQGSGKGEGDGRGEGSSAGNPVKSFGTIPQPPYPPISLENGEEGRVVLRISVAPNGKPTDVAVVKSSGFTRLDKQAARYARQGSFNTGGLYTVYTVPVNFKIQS